MNPYTRLQKVASEFATKVFTRRQVGMFTIPKEKLNDTYSMRETYERTHAAQQLGYIVELVADGQGLRIVYVERLPQRPWQF